MAGAGFYLVDGLIQGSQEWLNWRKGVIGASDAPTIMGENPWERDAHLLKEKLGLVAPFAGNAATREGQRLEPVARNLVSQKYGVDLRPVVIQDGEIPYIAASLDGLTAENNCIFEIKCGEKAYLYSKMRRAIPPYYRAQLQHMMMVSGHAELIYAVYRPSQPLLTYEVKRDESYISRLRRAETAFMDRLSARGHKAQQKFVGRRAS